MIRVSEVIVVEGRYDKNTLSQVVDATIIELGGFGVFNDRDKLLLLRRLAETRGLIILTDSDGAGFVIRNFLKGSIGTKGVKQAYIPEIDGVEKRKSSPSKEGKLGVEGMRAEVLIEALRRAGASFGDSDETPAPHSAGGITKALLYSLGLSGGTDSSRLRKSLLSRLELPSTLSATAMIDVLNLIITPDELRALSTEFLNADG